MTLHTAPLVIRILLEI